HTRSKRDWSSDVCSSDLPNNPQFHKRHWKSFLATCPVAELVVVCLLKTLSTYYSYLIQTSQYLLLFYMYSIWFIDRFIHYLKGGSNYFTIDRQVTVSTLGQLYRPLNDPL